MAIQVSPEVSPSNTFLDEMYYSKARASNKTCYDDSNYSLLPMSLVIKMEVLLQTVENIPLTQSGLASPTQCI